MSNFTPQEAVGLRLLRLRAAVEDLLVYWASVGSSWQELKATEPGYFTALDLFSKRLHRLHSSVDKLHLLLADEEEEAVS